MNKKKSAIQFLIGFGSIFLLWCIGGFTYRSYFNNLDISPEQSFYYLITPVAAVILIPVFLIIFAIVCKRKALNLMFTGALLGVGIPVLSSILSPLYTIDDGNILCWIFAFTIGLVLYPSAKLTHETYRGFNYFFLTYTEQRFIEEEIINSILVIAIIISVILFKVIKPQKAELNKPQLLIQ